MARSEAIRRRQDYAAPAFFGAATFSGVLYIILAKTLQAPAVMVTLVPVLLMLGYAAAVAFIKRYNLRDDQTGDNFYYMGFIYTLTSLAVSLVQYSSGSTVAEIVVNFGVAVASTITGIVLRILFHMMRRDPVEVESETRLALADAAGKVRRELLDTSIHMADLRRANQQMIVEAFDEIRTEVKRATDAAVEAVTTATKAAEAHAASLAEGGAADRVRVEMETAAKTLADLNKTLDEIALATIDHAVARGPWWSVWFLNARRRRVEERPSRRARPAPRATEAPQQSAAGQAHEAAAETSQ